MQPGIKTEYLAAAQVRQHHALAQCGAQDHLKCAAHIVIADATGIPSVIRNIMPVTPELGALDEWHRNVC
jgi:hypothetical protein